MASKTNEKFLAEAHSKFPHIEVLSDYKGSKEIMIFRCVKHNLIFEKTAYNFINSRCRCNLCAEENTRNSIKKSPEWFRKKLKEVNPTIEQISEYITMQDKVTVKCKQCGNVFSSKAQDLLNGHICKKCSIRICSGNNIKTHTWFLQQLKKYNPNYKNIEIIGKYKGVKETIKCKCNKCSYEWKVKASNLIDKRGGTGCPLCNQSKGESIVYNYLSDSKLDFETQKQFPNLIGVSGFPLSYDFYIPSHKLLIEINGSQHYKPIQYFGGTKKFNIQKEHDKRKRLYAKRYGYKLLEIKYFDHTYLNEMLNILQTNI